MADKIKFELEFPMNVSTPLLYQYISTSSGLAEWFAENVISRGEIFTFVWNGDQEKARVIAKKSTERVKFRWVDENNQDLEYFFERKSTRLNSSHVKISYAVFCLKKKN